MDEIQKKNVSEIAFEVKSKQGFLIRTTKSYWNVITTVKHPSVTGKEEHIKKTLIQPDEIRVSKKHKDVYLFYKKYENKYLCVIVRICKNNGFIVTAYYTAKIKEGKLKWKK